MGAVTSPRPGYRWQWVQAFIARLATARGRFWSIAFGVLLAAPCIGPRLALDDYILGLVARAKPVIPGLAQHGFNLFTFTTGRPEDNHALMDQGIMLPWWTEPTLKVAFCRPISSATHRFDFAIFPDIPPLFYVHSLLWLALLLVAVTVLYRRLESTPAIAGLALWGYAVDHASATVVSWASNRNALIAAALGCTAIVLHDAGRRTRRLWFLLASPLCFLLALLSSEFALGAIPYLLAYAIFLDTGSPRTRAVSVAPHLGLTMLWFGIYRFAGCGVSGSGAYVDPAHDPLTFAAAAPVNAIALLHGAWSLPPSDLVFLGPPAQRSALLALAATSVILATFVAWPFVKGDRVARFWAFGMVLSTLPVAASFPSDRLLLFVSLGTMGLLARMVTAFVRSRAEGLRMTPRDVVVAGFAVVHLVVAPLLRPLRAAQMQSFAEALEFAERDLFPNDKPLAKTVVIVNAPTLLFSDYVQAERAYYSKARPDHLYVLASASSPLQIRRTGPRDLIVTASQGFLYAPLERHYRSNKEMAPGETVVLSRMTARVVAQEEDGRPAAVQFSFPDPLESGALAFARWSGDRYVRFEPPMQGAAVNVPAEDVGRILLERAIHR